MGAKVAVGVLGMGAADAASKLFKEAFVRSGTGSGVRLGPGIFSDLATACVCDLGLLEVAIEELKEEDVCTPPSGVCCVEVVCVGDLSSSLTRLTDVSFDWSDNAEDDLLALGL